MKGIRPGQLYGYRVHGDDNPEAGLRFNPAKLLLDPYGKATAGTLSWQAPVFSYKLGDPAEDLAQDDADDAWGMPRSVVIQLHFDWQGDVAPRTPWSDSIILRDARQGTDDRHPEIPEEERGTSRTPA